MMESSSQQDIVQHCSVCEQMKPQLFYLASCQHRFCLDCCLGYIEARVNNFTQAKCLMEGCNSPLDQNQEVYHLLSKQTRKKIAKFKEYKHLQGDKHKRACRMAECEGHFTVKQKQANYTCNECNTEHCKKCHEVKHQGSCKQTQERVMAKLRYKKCPTCATWVQKSEGCSYISCKCGTQFCYTCGAQFDRDPCRMKQHWSKQYETRSVIYQIKLPLPQKFCQIPHFVFRLFVLFLVLPMSVLIWIPISFVLFVFGLWVCIFAGPVTFCHIIRSQIRNNDGLAGFLYALIIIFFPLFSLIMMLVFTALVIIYPCCRRGYHHGIYDPFDRAISAAATCYLSMLACCVGEE